jgi:hypothetical protein
VIVYVENRTGSCDNVEAISVSSSAMAGIVIFLNGYSMLFWKMDPCIQPCTRFVLTPSLLALLGLCAALLVIHTNGACSEGSRGRRLAEVIPATYLAPLVLASARYLICRCDPCVITLFQYKGEDPCTVHVDRV